MGFILVTYDLRKDKDYQRLYKQIDKTFEYIKVADSSYVLKTDYETYQVGQELSGCFDNDDLYFISKIYPNAVGRIWNESDWSFFAN